MATMAAKPPAARRDVALKSAAARVLLFVVVLAALWGLWEGYRWLWMHEQWTWPFVVNDTTMPHLGSIVAALWGSASPGGVGRRLVTVLVKGALFTAKEAAAGFAIGALVGFALGVVLVHVRLLQRGLLPWVVASQTVPILVVAPMIVVWANPKLPSGLRDWGAVALIAAYLTFFPVTVNTIRGLQAVDRRRLELLRRSAAGRRTSYERGRDLRRLEALRGDDRGGRDRPRDRRARVHLADRPLGVRQVDAPANHRRPDRADKREGRRQRQARAPGAQGPR